MRTHQGAREFTSPPPAFSQGAIGVADVRFGADYGLFDSSSKTAFAIAVSTLSSTVARSGCDQERSELAHRKLEDALKDGVRLPIRGDGEAQDSLGCCIAAKVCRTWSRRTTGSKPAPVRVTSTRQPGVISRGTDNETRRKEFFSRRSRPIGIIGVAAVCGSAMVKNTAALFDRRIRPAQEESRLGWRRKWTPLGSTQDDRQAAGVRNSPGAANAISTGDAQTKLAYLTLRERHLSEADRDCTVVPRAADMQRRLNRTQSCRYPCARLYGRAKDRISHT